METFFTNFSFQFKKRETDDENGGSILTNKWMMNQKHYLEEKQHFDKGFSTSFSHQRHKHTTFARQSTTSRKDLLISYSEHTSLLKAS